MRNYWFMQTLTHPPPAYRITYQTHCAATQEWPYCTEANLQPTTPAYQSTHLPQAPRLCCGQLSSWAPSWPGPPASSSPSPPSSAPSSSWPPPPHGPSAWPLGLKINMWATLFQCDAAGHITVKLKTLWEGAWGKGAERDWLIDCSSLNTHG